MPKSKTVKSKKGTTKSGSTGLTTTVVRQFGQGLQMQVGSTSYVNPPSSSAPVLRGPRVRDFPGTFSYTAGFLTMASTTRGAPGVVYFAPNLGTTAIFASGQAPVAPADIASIGTGQGWGSVSMNALMSLFARKRFERIRLCVEPFALGASTTAGISFAYAPVRGGLYSAGSVAGTGGYIVTSGGAAPPTISSGTVLQMRDGVVFPSFVPMKFDLTPYIAGGSGAKQNEFFLSALQAQGDITSPPNATVVVPQLMIPCGFFAQGIYSGSVPTSPVSVGIVRIELDMTMMDWLGDAFGGLQNSVNVGVSDSKSDPSATHSDPSRLGSAAYVGTPQPSSKDEKQASPDQRGYWFSSKPETAPKK